MKKSILFLFCFVLYLNNLFSNDLYNRYQHIFIEEIEPYKRIGIKYAYKDNLQKEDPEKEQNFILFGEYQFFTFYSLYIHIPYTIHWVEGSENRKYLDHFRILNKFQIDKNYYKFYVGLKLDLPRNHDKAGDVPSDVGYIEPYIGFGIFMIPFMMKFSIHWNTQSNTKFKEERDQQFERKWIYNLSMGLIYQNWQFWLETQYQYLYDPKDKKTNIFFIGPSLGYKWNNLNISLIYIFPSNEYKYNKEILLQFQKIF
ncbi:MAG: hypothetical protein KatS3mg129_3298 [Leptospiraceae bacterium]|nr:MAG: hypothetical protein KatS3mg129_3298 [Leptospiraceae bacterium]